MAKMPPGSAYFGTDRPENALPDEDPGMPADLGAMPPPPPGGMPMQAPPVDAPLGAAPGAAGYEDAPEIIAQMAEQYMGIPRAQVDAMAPDQYMQLLDQLEQGYPQDERLLGAISSIRPFLLQSDPSADAMPLAPEAPSAPGVSPPPAEPNFRPDQPY